MRDLDDFLPFIATYAPAAPEPVTLRFLRRAAIEFCERTRLWRDTAKVKTSGKFAEIIDVPDGALVHEVESCSIDCQPLDPISLDELARVRPDWRDEAVGCGGANWYVCPQVGTVQVVPRSSGALTLEIVLKPTLDATTLPDFLFDLYGEMIADGAAGRVLTMPQVDYANPAIGAGLLLNFRSNLDQLSNQGRRGQQRARNRTRGRYF